VLPRKLSSRRTSDGGFEVEFVVPFDLALFAGHFAAAPIVPGAVLVGWAGRIAAAEAAWAHGTAHVRSMKFRRIVQPGPRYSLTGHCTSGGDRLDVRIESTQGLHVSATLLADD
jgi:3-hydroxymyristoyl/3-hydroxydecanoyl-(acyl carrier protein) dehydratase